MFYAAVMLQSLTHQDLKQQNELMLETKSLLEQKAASLTARAEAVDDLETELAALRVQLDSLNQVRGLAVRLVGSKDSFVCKCESE